MYTVHRKHQKGVACRISSMKKMRFALVRYQEALWRWLRWGASITARFISIGQRKKTRIGGTERTELSTSDATGCLVLFWYGGLQPVLAPQTWTHQTTSLTPALQQQATEPAAQGRDSQMIYTCTRQHDSNITARKQHHPWLLVDPWKDLFTS